MSTMAEDYLLSVRKQFEYYKMLGDKAMAQVTEEEHLFWQPNAESNSIAVIVKHLSGNMVSRWTDFLTTDGEKANRDRDGEFVGTEMNREEVLALWEFGWKVFLDTLNSLIPDDLTKIIYIRNQGHTVIEAINRQLAHYPYHVGQIVYLARMVSQDWKSLSIPRNASADYNKDKFAQDKKRSHFTDEYLGKKPGADKK